MQAIHCHGGGKRPDLLWEATAEPPMGNHDVLLEVSATAVNRADLLQARGLYPPPPGDSPVLGLEAAGVVLKAGRQVRGWKPGDRVCALVPGGGYAERAVVHPEMLLPLPAGWSFAMGAAVPEAWLTAFSNLMLEGRLEAGETVLIHAGGSGVGTAAIQLAVLAGARVAVTAGSEPKLSRCRQLGAHIAIDYHAASFADLLAEAAGEKGVDLILDCVGGPYLADHLQLLNPNGRLVLIGVMGGRSAAIDLVHVLGKSLRIIGTRLRARPTTEKIAITREFRSRFWHLFANGRLNPVIDRVFPITAAGEAHAYVEANRNFGKVILAVRPDATAL
jgi:putative PIG3 family NAD(P)H quinone oxidoreductase